MDVSVIVPCYNGEAFLAETLSAALDQTQPPKEIIVVDDGSEDGSLDIARSFEGAVQVHSRVRQGAGAARHFGAGVARGDALLFLDADDLLGPTAVEALTTVLSRHGSGVARCPWYRLDLRGVDWIPSPASCAPRAPGQDDLDAWLTGWYHPPCSLLWTRDAYLRSGGWDALISVNDDGDLMMRALAVGVELHEAVTGAAYYRRPAPGKSTVSSARFSRQGIESRIEVVDRIASRIAESGRLARYRRSLAKAYDLVAQDCRAKYPDLYGRCRRSAGALGGFGRLANLASPHRWPGTSRNPSSSRALRPVFAEPEHGTARLATPAIERPLVSVVIPTYNRGDLVWRALNSVLAQTYDEFEALVVDDASTDDTAAVLASFSDPRIRSIRQPRNRGAAAARNRGLVESRGELIAFLDSDDEWLPDKLAKQAAVFAESSIELGLVYTGVEELDEQGARTVTLPAVRGDVYSRLLRENHIYGGGSGVMIRRSALTRVGLFDEDLPAIEDYDYWLRVAHFYRVDFVKEPLVRYFNARNTDGPDGRARVSLNFDANLRARERFFQKHCRSMRDAGVAHEFLIESARRHLRETVGDTQTGRALVLRSWRERPFQWSVYPWIPYMLLPARARRTLRHADGNLRRLLGGGFGRHPAGVETSNTVTGER